MSILLTGASGFAGAHMLRGLLDNGHDSIVCPVTFSHGGSRNRLQSLLNEGELKNVKFLEFDLATKKLDLDKYSISLVINFASESHVDSSISTPFEFVTNNIALMVNLLEAIRDTARLIPILHISTDEVYGEIGEQFDNIEWELPLRPSNPYSASKASQEQLIYAYCRTFRFSSLILNITNMIGEAQNVEKFIPRVISRLFNQKEINVDTNLAGQIGSRRYIYVGDVVRAIIFLMTKPEIFQAGFIDRYHIGGDQSFSNLEMIEIISHVLKRLPILVFSPSPRPGYDLEYNINTNKMKKTGWVQNYSIPEALERIVDWTLQNPNWMEFE